MDKKFIASLALNVVLVLALVFVMIGYSGCAKRGIQSSIDYWYMYGQEMECNLGAEELKTALIEEKSAYETLVDNYRGLYRSYRSCINKKQ